MRETSCREDTMSDEELKMLRLNLIIGIESSVGVLCHHHEAIRKEEDLITQAQESIREITEELNRRVNIVELCNTPNLFAPIL
jgi:hypothetical protein